MLTAMPSDASPSSKHGGNLSTMKHLVSTGTVLVVFLVTIPCSAESPQREWRSWRGPDRDGICKEVGLLREWKEDGPKLAWRVDGLGRGYSSVAIADGRIFTIGRHSREASLMALELDGGKEIWRTAVGGGDPNCTPTVDGDLVYALGREGDLLCARVKDGAEVWRKSFRKDFGGRMMSGWGYSESPLVDGDRLVCTPGGNDAVIVALDKKSGEEIWRARMPEEAGDRGNDGAGYSSIVITEGGGVRQYVQLTGRGVISVAADDGRFLWIYNRIANNTANIPTPIVHGDTVFCSTGYGTGAALLKLSPAEQDGKKGVRADEVYFLDARTMQNHHGGMVRVGDTIYCGHGHNRGHPLALDMKTGEVIWKSNDRPGDGSAAVLYADGHLYFRYEDGVMALIEANPKEYRLKGTFRIATRNGKSWPHPVIVDGKLYLRDQQTLLCYEVR